MHVETARAHGKAHAGSRRDWRELAVAMRQACDHVSRTDGLEPITDRTLLHTVSRGERLVWPTEIDSERKIAAAFVMAARAVVGAGMPELRVRMAPAVSALAEAVEGLLADHLNAETAGWRARMGEGNA